MLNIYSSTVETKIMAISAKGGFLCGPIDSKRDIYFLCSGVNSEACNVPS